MAGANTMNTETKQTQTTGRKADKMNTVKNKATQNSPRAGGDTLEIKDKLSLTAEHHGISFNVKKIESNPQMSPWRGASHYKVRLRRSEEWAGSKNVRQLTAYISLGSTHTKAPSCGHILEIVLQDVLEWVRCGGLVEVSGTPSGLGVDGEEALRLAEIQYRKWRSFARRTEIFFGPCLLGTFAEIIDGEEDPETWDGVVASGEAV